MSKTDRKSKKHPFTARKSEIVRNLLHKKLITKNKNKKKLNN